jgi:uncharacterized membrane protein
MKKRVKKYELAYLTTVLNPKVEIVWHVLSSKEIKELRNPAYKYIIP